MPVDPVRDAAVDTLLRIETQNAYVDEAIDRTLSRRGQGFAPRGRRFFTQLVYGTVRHRILADHVLTPLLKQPLAQLPDPIRVVLEMGVFQSLFCGNVTPPSLVHTSVDVAKRKGHAGTARLVNAVLRRVPQTLDEVSFPDPESNLAEFLSLRYSLPEWIPQKWIADEGPEAARAIAEVSAVEAPRTARVNTRLMSREDLLKTLAKADQPAAPHPEVESAIVFGEGASPLRAKLFQRGAFYMQDPASMLAAHLLDPQSGSRILDLCAAPGGKALHLAELIGDTGVVIAADRTPNRLHRIVDNAERMAANNVSPVAADGIAPPFRRTFDAVLVDAPCSGLGTLRRHPDLKYRIQPRDLPALVSQQAALLRSAIDLCTIKGTVVYSVCTFTPEETTAVVEGILGDGRVEPECGPAWMDRWKIAPGMYRIHPGQDGLDGYFLTRLQVRS